MMVHGRLAYQAVLLTIGFGLLGLPLLAAETPRKTPRDAQEWQEDIPREELENESLVFLPRGHLFTPLIANPKAFLPQAAWLQVHDPDSHYSMVNVAYGLEFGLARWKRRWQFDLVAALFAQFNLDLKSSALLNADYLFGFSLVHRRERFSFRARLTHQSSHLGDEFLLLFPIERIELSVNGVDVLVSNEWTRWRLYGGGFYALRIDPAGTKRGALDAGVEFRGPKKIGRKGRFIAGLDVQALQAQDWEPLTSLKAGIEWRNSGPGQTAFRPMAEGFDGPFPFGQFILDPVDVRWYGIGLYFVR